MAMGPEFSTPDLPHDRARLQTVGRARTRDTREIPSRGQIPKCSRGLGFAAMNVRTGAREAHERGRVEMWGVAPLRTHELLATEALAVADVDPGRAALMLADASAAAVGAGETRQALATSGRAMRLARGVGGHTEAT